MLAHIPIADTCPLDSKPLECLPSIRVECGEGFGWNPGEGEKIIRKYDICLRAIRFRYQQDSDRDWTLGQRGLPLREDKYSEFVSCT